MQNIAKYFEKAKLAINVTNKPINSISANENNNKIFQMTIDGGKPESFRIFRGIGNDVRVLDCDGKKQQVLLFVKEPKRTFSETHYDRQQHKDIKTIRETPGGIRRYLMGKDERRLFISELQNESGRINTVKDAHYWLKPKTIKDKKWGKDLKIVRQGEWFFIAITSKEKELIKERSLSISSKAALPTRGKQHICDFLLSVEGQIFVKGNVRHNDHKTIKFIDWQRAYRNTEKNSNIHGWID